MVTAGSFHLFCSSATMSPIRAGLSTYPAVQFSGATSLAPSDAPTHRLQVGAVVHRAMAQGTCAHAGWHAGEPGERDATGGGCQSPASANLFLHYAFDRWMHEHHPAIPFERYADDRSLTQTRKSPEKPGRFTLDSGQLSAFFMFDVCGSPTRWPRCWPMPRV